MALDPRLILNGVQAGIQNAKPFSNLMAGAQQQQQFAGEEQRQNLLAQQAEQQAGLAPLQQRAMQQQLAAGDISQQIAQRELDLLGVPDVPTAKELAFNAAKLSALPNVEAKRAEISRMKRAAAGRTTHNLDELEAAYAQSPEAGDQLLNAGVPAFERSGLLTPMERAEAASAGQPQLEESTSSETKAQAAKRVLKLSDVEASAFSVLDEKVQDSLLKEALSPKEKLKAKEEVVRAKKGLAVRKSAVSILENILDNKNRSALRDVVGPIEGRFDFRLQGDEADLVAQISELGDTLTADNLDLMSGVLSESDIALLKNLSAGGLNRAVNESTFVSRATEILGRLRGEIGEPHNTQAQQQPSSITLPNGVVVKRVGVSG